MSTDKTTLERLRIHRDAPRARTSPGWVAPAIAGVLILGGVFWWWSSHRAAVLEVETIVAHAQAEGGQTTLLNASGYVTARRAATVSSKVTGKVVEILVEEGRKVEEGEVLARLDKSNVEASLHLAEAQLKSAETSLEEIKPNLAFAQRELKRFTDLSGSRVVSDSDLRRAEMEARALEGRLVRQTADIEVRRSEIAGWQQQIDDTIIRAPFSGIVTSKNAQPGEMISPMSVGGFTRTGICTIVDMSSLEIEVDVNESYIGRVQPGQPVEATLDAYPTWRIPAKVLAIIPTADRQKATVKVRISFDQLDPRILPDMAVKVAFRSAKAEAKATAPAASVIVPKGAIQHADGREIIWVVRDGRVERRAVSTRATAGDEISITAGLNDGEHLVINAPRELADGSRVTEKPR